MDPKLKTTLHHKPALIIGHRGASAVAPENTMAAFQLAIALGADGIELDVQLSADGEPVVIHDRRVDRTSDGRGFVSEFTAAQLASLNAGWRFTRRLESRPRLRARVQLLAERLEPPTLCLNPQPIPLLRSVLEHLSGSGLARIYVEIKGSELTRPALLTRTIAIIRRLEVEPIVTLLSFDHSIIGRASQLAPAVRRAITIPGLVRRLPTARSIISASRAVEAGEVALHYSIASPRLVRMLHQSGLQVAAWTANRKVVMKRLVWLGVDSIMTNHVDRLKSVIQGFNGDVPSRRRDRRQIKTG